MERLLLSTLVYICEKYVKITKLVLLLIKLTLLQLKFTKLSFVCPKTALKAYLISILGCQNDEIGC
jgi:hypothetical protein